MIQQRPRVGWRRVGSDEASEVEVDIARFRCRRMGHGVAAYSQKPKLFLRRERSRPADICPRGPFFACKTTLSRGHPRLENHETWGTRSPLRSYFCFLSQSSRDIALIGC